MKFHCAIIDQLLGFDGEKYQCGMQVNGIVESEIIANYGQTIMDALEWLGTQYEHINTRRRPGFTEHVRLQQMGHGKLGVRCGLGRMETGKEHLNCGQVTYTDKSLEKVAGKLLRVINAWGKKHGGGKFIENAMPTFVEGSPAHLILEPFAVNGAHSYELTSQPVLDELAKSMAKTLSDWLIEQNPTAVGYKPKQLIDRPWQTR